MQQMFNPKKVVVVGVSTAPDNLAKNILHNLLEFNFPGEVYAVGNVEGEIEGKKIYKSPLDLPTDVDFAAFLIPARYIPKLMDECGQKGVRRALISSGGFSERGEEGRELQRQVLDVASKYGIRFLGPNCLGITNLENGLVLPFGRMNKDAFLKGTNSIIGQSGGVTLRCAALFSEAGLGFNKAISIGNKVNTDEVDLLEFLSEDPGTEAIFMYLEDIRRGRELMEVAKRCPKPIVVMKSNTSPVTAEIARSHTAALASDDRVVDAALRQAGMMRVTELESFVTFAKAFTLPKCRGDNIIVISPSGGFSVIAADVSGNYGFHLPKLPSAVVHQLEERSRAGVVRFTNPLDFGDLYDRTATLYAVQELLKLPEISAMAVTVPTERGTSGMGFTGSQAEQLLLGIKEASLELDKPVAAAVLAGQDQLSTMIKQAGFPLFRTID